MKLHIPVLFSIALLFSINAECSSSYEEMNIRQTIENASMNKVIGARLRGMTAGETVRGEIGASMDSVEDCTTQIGNSVSDGSLVGGSQDIIIIGDIINLCQ